MKDRRRYARPTNLLEAVAACGVSIFGIIALLPAAGAAPGPEMGIFIPLMLCCVLMLAAVVCMAGYLVVDERGARLYKLWTRVELPWEEVRCVSRFAYLTGSGHRYRSYDHHRNVVLLSPLAEPWAAEGVGSDLHFTGNVLRFGGARVFALGGDVTLYAHRLWEGAAEKA